MKRRLVLLVVAALFLCGVGMRAEAAFPITCGTALPDEPGPGNVTFKLTHNLTCAPSFDPALSLGDHTTLNLNGHVLTGSGSGNGVQAIGKDHATVTNGTIKSFVTPVFFEFGNQNHATRLTLFGGSAEVNANGTSHALIANNKMHGFGLTCVEVNSASETTVQSNTMNCSTNGVKIDNASTNTKVSGNVIHAGTIGVNVNTTGSASTRVVANVVGGGATGIDIGASGDEESITGNRVSGASSDGIHVASGATTIAIGGNTSSGNGNDGIFVQSSDAGTSVGDNVTNNNGNYGIEATAATDDAGGDKAKGNGRFLQCIFVLCQ